MEVNASINMLIMTVHLDVPLTNTFQLIMISLMKWNFQNWKKLLLLERQSQKCRSNYFQQTKNGKYVYELNPEVCG